ncbi:fimbrillin family protein [Limibacterium fermenti]|uniref:fimbrillin family protein n=1 Tax=Limibacterium fermenti TaxID=3229863 RepID=UPI003A70175E
MKIRTLIYALMALGVAASITSCRNDITDPVTTDQEAQLTLLPTVAERNEEVVVTRAAGSNPFFEDGDKITVKITTSRTDATANNYTYTYGSGTFTGGFYFPPDNTYIKTLDALWPAEGSQGRLQIVTDQRKYEDYRQADRLKATANTYNIMPTAEPVPLVFHHEHSNITFRLAGQNANGLIIKSLLLELKANIDEDANNTLEDAAFWAYSGDGTEGVGKGALNAKMILPKGVQFGPRIQDDGRTKIGLVKVGAENDTRKDYTGVIYIPNKTNIVLQENTDYLVTLTPEGYDLLANITIAGFTQEEGRVAVPFQLPVFNGTSSRYDISTIAQLITISWLLESDLNGQKQSVWAARTFDIVSPIQVSAKVKAEGYLKAEVLIRHKVKFTNTDNATYYSDNTKVFEN